MVATIGPLECELAATMVPDTLAARLRDFAAKEDELILTTLRREVAGDMNSTRHPKWQAGYAAGTLANDAMFCVARFAQTNSDAYKELVIAMADQYLGAGPEEDVDA